MDKKIKTAVGTTWFFDYDNEEFERVRNLCLEEDNWLRENYTQDKLKITDHDWFTISYSNDGDPICFGGLKRYNSHVGRLFNRFYQFPKHRSYSGSKMLLNNINRNQLKAFKQVIGTSIILSKKDYDLFFISMQQRKSLFKQAIWWKFTKNYFLKNYDNWNSYDKGLVQVHDGELASCYQNIIYYTKNNYTFEDWNPKVMSYNEHALRMKYEASLRNTT